MIDTAGRIVTNFHVVRGAEQIEVSFSNRDSVRARVVGTDPSTDLALPQGELVDAQALRPLDLGNSDRVRVGDSVVAIRNPLGLEQSVTAGIISAPASPAHGAERVHDRRRHPDRRVHQQRELRRPADRGEQVVVGVNTAIATGNTGARGNIGIGFAVPMNTVRNVVSQLIEKGRVEHPFIGVGAQEVDQEIAQLFNLGRARLLIVRVYENSGAAGAEMQAGTREVVIDEESYLLGGDFIVEIDGSRLTGGGLSARRSWARRSATRSRSTPTAATKRSFDVKLGRQPPVSQDYSRSAGRSDRRRYSAHAERCPGEHAGPTRVRDP